MRSKFPAATRFRGLLSLYSHREQVEIVRLKLTAFSKCQSFLRLTVAGWARLSGASLTGPRENQNNDLNGLQNAPHRLAHPTSVRHNPIDNSPLCSSTPYALTVWDTQECRKQRL